MAEAAPPRPGVAGHRRAGRAGRRLLLDRAPDLRARGCLGDRAAGRRRTRRRRPSCGSGVPRPRGATGRWPARGPSASPCGPGSTRPRWSGRRPGHWRGARRAGGRADGLGRRGALVDDRLPRLDGVYGAHLGSASPVSEAPVLEVLVGARRVLAGEIRGGRPSSRACPGLGTGARRSGRQSNGRLTTRAFSLLYAHLDSAITLSPQPTCARNGRRLRLRARQPGQVPLPRPWDGRFGEDLGEGTN